MTTWDKLGEDLSRHLDRAKFRTQFSGKVGLDLGGGRVVQHNYPDGRALPVGHIWVRLATEREAIPMLALGHIYQPNAPVICDRYATGEWYIVGLDAPRATDMAGYSAGEMAVPDVAIPPNVTLNVRVRDIKDGRVGRSSAGGLNVRIESFVHNNKVFPTIDPFPVTPPSTPMAQAWAAIYCNPRTATYHQRLGADWLVDPIDAFAIPIPSEHLLLGHVLLTNGDTSIPNETTRFGEPRDILNRMTPYNNYDATTAPTSADDEDAGWQAGSVWIVNNVDVYDHLGGGVWRQRISGMEDFTLAADSGTPQTVGDGDTLQIIGGTGIDTAVSSPDTLMIGLDSGTQAALANAAPKDATYVTLTDHPDLPNDITVNSVVAYGSLSARPSPGIAGRLYLCSDTPYLYRDTGSVWVVFGSINRVFAPSAANISADLLTPATVPASQIIRSNDFLLADIRSGNTDAVKGAFKASLPAPWLIHARIAGTALFNTALGVTTGGYGIMLRSGVDGKIIIFGVRAGSSGTLSLIVQHYTNETTPIIPAVFSLSISVCDNLWLGVRDQGGQLAYLYSNDGIHWFSLYSESNTAHGTMNRYGVYGIAGANTGSRTLVSLLSWNETAL